MNQVYLVLHAWNIEGFSAVLRARAMYMRVLMWPVDYTVSFVQLCPLRWGQGISSPDVASSLEIRPQICLLRAPRAHTHRTAVIFFFAKMRQPPGPFAEQLPLDPRAPRSPWFVACCGAAVRLCVCFGFSKSDNHPSKKCQRIYWTWLLLIASASRLVITIHTVWKSYLGILIFRRQNECQEHL